MTIEERLRELEEQVERLKERLGHLEVQHECHWDHIADLYVEVGADPRRLMLSPERRYSGVTESGSEEPSAFEMAMEIVETQEPVVHISHEELERRSRGRPPIGESAMTPAERVRRHRAKR